MSAHIRRSWLALARNFRSCNRKKYRLGITPHFTEYDHVSKHYQRSDVLVIDMGCGSVEAVISSIKACERTVSSSLYGLVFSHAYSIPTRQVSFGNKIFGDGTKFIDYYRGLSQSYRAPAQCASHSESFEYLLSLPDEVFEIDTTKIWELMFVTPAMALRKSALFNVAV